MIRFSLFAGALAIGGLIAVTQPALAQSPASATPAAPVAQMQDHQEHQAAAGQTADGKAQETQMMDMQKMMADMKAADATLDALVTRMNTAKGNAKVDVIAELLTTMVQQQRTMHDGMMQMHGQMMMQMHGQMMKPMGGVK